MNETNHHHVMEPLREISNLFKQNYNSLYHPPSCFVYIEIDCYLNWTSPSSILARVVFNNMYTHHTWRWEMILWRRRIDDREESEKSVRYSFIRKKWRYFIFYYIIHNSLRNDYSNCAPMNHFYERMKSVECISFQLFLPKIRISMKLLASVVDSFSKLSGLCIHFYNLQLKFLELRAIFYLSLDVLSVWKPFISTHRLE
jgi:hypothetical protein